MTTFALRGLLGRKLRTVLTAIAIVLGVATVSGTYVLTDSINNAFHSIFYETRAGSDAVVSGKSPFDVSSGSGTAAPSGGSACACSAISTTPRTRSRRRS